MRIVRFLAALLASTALVLPMDPAMAGGSWLETRRDHYTIDQRVVARGTFGGGSYTGTVRDGPYYAYLVPENRYLPAIGGLPSWAIPLGRMEIWRGAGRICCWIARLAFNVPDVEPGFYSIDYCNRPCTVDGVGDLIGGWIWVGRTLAEARLQDGVAALERENEGLARRARRAENRADRLADERSELENDVLTLRNKVTSLEQEIGALPAAPASRESSPWPLWTWAITAIAGVAVGALIGSRRSQRVRSRQAASSDRWSALSGAVNPPGETDEAVHPSSPEPHPSAPSRTKARPEGRPVGSVR